MIICVDFDGTIVDHEYPKIGKPVPKAIDVMQALVLLGHQLILFTMRSGETLDEAVIYLKKNNVELWGINENPDQSTWTDSRKVYGHKYIDDAALGCPLIHIDGFCRPCVDWVEVGIVFGMDLKPPLRDQGLTILQTNPDYAVSLTTGDRYYGWLFKRHPDGQFVTIRKLEDWELTQAEDQKHYDIVIEGSGSLLSSKSGGVRC